MGFQRCMTLQIELMTVNPRPRHSPCKSFRAPQTPVEPSRLDFEALWCSEKALREEVCCAVCCVRHAQVALITVIRSLSESLELPLLFVSLGEHWQSSRSLYRRLASGVFGLLRRVPE